MRTIETTVTIEPDGKAVLQLPPDIRPGERRVVLVIEEPPVTSAGSLPPLSLQSFNWPAWPADSTFRREDLM